MDPHTRDTATQFSRQAEAYAASASHARGADLEILLDFADLPVALAEAARVLGPKGRLVVEDRLAPGEAPLAGFLEALEKRRDPTHVHSLDREEWFAACASAGLQIVRDRVHHKRHDFDPWIGRTGLEPPEIAAITADILAAPAPIREALFEIEAGRVRILKDRKLILRAQACYFGSTTPAGEPLLAFGLRRR